jgi:alpha-L-rhamnosidase
MSDVRVVDVRAEHRRDAFGIGTARPRLSWRVETSVGAWEQAAAEIEVVDRATGTTWRTGRVETPASRLVRWPTAVPSLRSRQRATARVRVWGDDGSASGWSESLAIEVGLLGPGDWTAQWISPPWDDDTIRPVPSPVFRHAFPAGAVVRARLHVTACGVYEATLNGQPCSDHVLAPGWTSYRHRLRYQTLDVTPLVRTGGNELVVTVADGWFRGRLGWEPAPAGRNRYGDRLALLAQLELEDVDGGVTIVGTGPGWDVATGPVRAADLYDGEIHDARRTAGDDGWRAAMVVTPDVGRLEAPLGPPVRRIEEVAPVEAVRTPSGRCVLDFGQNLVGRVRFTVDAEPGTEIVLRHAEVLEHGEPSYRTLRTAAATDRYTCRGDGPETWEPQFTFHGFRYVDVEGWPGDLDPTAFRAVVCHSDLERTGTFACSDARVTRLHENVVWSMRGNFLDVPTDCPQRDERLGWTGDLQVFAPAASFLYDTGGLLSSWLADLAAEQADDGVVPLVVPSVMDENAAAAGWGDAAVLVPWTVHERLGDVDLLARQLPSMRAWVDAVARLAGDDRVWTSGFQFGDWLDPAAPNDRPYDTRTDPDLCATAYLARSAEVVGRVCGLIGDDDAGDRYLRLAGEVRAAFRREYVTATGRVVSDSQTAYALALVFGLLEDADLERRAGERLGRLVRRARYRIATGFLGTPVVCDALTGAGHGDAAYRMLLQTAPPSWLYAVTMGATTIWERWDALLPDGTVNGDSMTSLNHYALGAVADWLHRVVAGIAPVEPGYRRARIAPMPGGRLRWARASLRTPYGELSSSWRVEGSTFTLAARVPPSTTVEVVLPADGGRHEVGSGSHEWSLAVDPAWRRRWFPPMSTRSRVGDLREDPEAWALLVARYPDLERIALGSDLEGRTLRELFSLAGPPPAESVFATIDGDLAAISG